MWCSMWAVAEAGVTAEDQQQAIWVALGEELARYDTDEGIVMDSSSWKVTARKPG